MADKNKIDREIKQILSDALGIGNEQGIDVKGDYVVNVHIYTIYFSVEKDSNIYPLGKKKG